MSSSQVGSLKIYREESPEDAGLVVAYQQAAQAYGPTSPQAAAAFEPIFYRFYPVVRALASARTSNLDLDDLIQETFLTVWQRLSSGNETITYLPGLISHSLRREHANLVQRHHRKSWQKNPATGQSLPAVVYSLDRPLTDEATTTWHELLADPTADHAQTSLLSRQNLAQWLTGMPAEYRQAVLAQLEGYSLHEMAGRYAWTLDQAKKRVWKGKAWLLQRLADQAAA